jgi:hypothetical protein
VEGGTAVGFKDWMLFYVEGDAREALLARPALDRVATRDLVVRLHPTHRITEIDDGTLSEECNPPDNLVYAGCYSGLCILCTGEVAVDLPSRLDRRFLAEAGGRTVYLHTMHSVVDWFAYAIWAGDGTLQRALSVAPDGGVVENIGAPLPFEAPYWAGEHPVRSEPGRRPYPLPFHPLDLGEDALYELFGLTYGTDGGRDDETDMMEIKLAGFEVRPPETRRRWFRRRGGPRAAGRGAAGLGGGQPGTRSTCR